MLHCQFLCHVLKALFFTKIVLKLSFAKNAKFSSAGYSGYAPDVLPSWVFNSITITIAHKKVGVTKSCCRILVDSNIDIRPWNPYTYYHHMVLWKQNDWTLTGGIPGEFLLQKWNQGHYLRLSCAMVVNFQYQSTENFYLRTYLRTFWYQNMRHKGVHQTNHNHHQCRRTIGQIIISNDYQNNESKYHYQQNKHRHYYHNEQHCHMTWIGEEHMNCI